MRIAIFKRIVKSSISRLLQAKVFAACFLLFALTPTLSQISQERLRHITNENGLSNTTINCIHQGYRGFMYFGTRDGLNRYDGINMTVFKNDPANPSSISDNFIRCIYENKNHEFWVGTSYGLNRFDRVNSSFKSYKHNPGHSNSLSSNVITGISPGEEHHLWVATLDGGLNYFDTKKAIAKHYRHKANDANSISSDSINCIFKDRQNRLWVGTQNGIDCIDSKNSVISSNILKNNKPVTAIVQDANGDMWFGVEDIGLVGYDILNSKIKSIDSGKPGSSESMILSLLADKKGNIWVGKVNEGLTQFDTKTQKTYDYHPSIGIGGGLSSATISAIFQDRQGNLWFGTHRGGVNLYSAGSDKFKLYRKGTGGNTLSYNDVKAFFQDADESIWIGTDGGGLNRLDPKTGNFSIYRTQAKNPRSLSSDAIQTIAADAQNNIWVGTWGGGLNLFDKKTKTFIHFQHDLKKPGTISSNFLQKLFLDKQGNFWVATYYGGLNLWNPKTKTFDHITQSPDKKTAFSGKNVVSIEQDKEGNLWFGTDDGGLNRYDFKTRQFSHYLDKTSKRLDSRVLFTDSKGQLWVGTKGLYRYDKAKDRFVLFTKKSGLDVNFIKGITEDSSNNLWISTSAGLFRLNPETFAIKAFNTYDGLQDMEFEANSYLKTKDGQMFFGGINGMNSFYPKDIKINEFIPPVFITEFQLFNKRVFPSDDPKAGLRKDISYTREINLSYKQSSITFSFAALNYINSQNNKYCYKMEGLDPEWSIPGMDRKAIYTNLPPGDYTFRVLASNNDGKWNNVGAAIKITITPPFWKSWWFKSIVTLLLFFGIYLFYRHRLRRVEKRNALLEEQVKERTLELATQANSLKELNIELTEQKEHEAEAREEAEKANQAKSIFLATMSHEIRTPLNGVIGMASLLAETQLDKEQQDYNETIINSGESLLMVINDILDFSKIESGKMDIEQEEFDLRQAVESVMDIFMPRLAKMNIDLIYELDSNVPKRIIGDSLRLKQILINLVGNAIKFTSEGEIFLKIGIGKHSGNDFEIRFDVRDTGIGIPQEKLSQLFQAFSQVDSSTSRKYGGTGLGLAICTRLVELMGGEISVKSTYGEGSVFSFTIKTEEGREETKNTYDLSAYKGTSILVVDDNETSRNVLMRQMEQWNLNPIAATSGENALEIVSKNNSIKVVVTDMRMPGMDGVKLAKALKNTAENIPVIVLNPVRDEIKKKHSDLFLSILPKPVKQRHLRKCILTALGGSEIEAQQEKQKSAVSEVFAQTYPLRILVAEDNKINQKFIEFILKKLGYEADIVHNGIEVLKIMETKTYDVILMDVQMPEMDGFEATSIIKNKEGGKPVIVAMTANAMFEDKELCLQQGMDDYLGKPMKIEEVTELLSKIYTQLQ
ncbi:MAG: two-component regulator propeller domain-containing protein [Phycisphaerales bacterium]